MSHVYELYLEEWEGRRTDQNRPKVRYILPKVSFGNPLGRGDDVYLSVVNGNSPGGDYVGNVRRISHSGSIGDDGHYTGTRVHVLMDDGKDADQKIDRETLEETLQDLASQ